MMPGPFDWDQSYEVRVPVIDEQHRDLLSSIKMAISQLSEENNPQELSPLLDGIAHGAGVHFKFEKDLMEAYADPRFQALRNEDTSLLPQLHRFKERDLAGVSIHKLEHVSAFVSVWLSTHINTQDRPLAAHLNLVGAKEAQA